MLGVCVRVCLFLLMKIRDKQSKHINRTIFKWNIQPHSPRAFCSLATGHFFHDIWSTNNNNCSLKNYTSLNMLMSQFHRKIGYFSIESKTRIEHSSPRKDSSSKIYPKIWCENAVSKLLNQKYIFGFLWLFFCWRFTLLYTNSRSYTVECIYYSCFEPTTATAFTLQCPMGINGHSTICM